jgi:two-component system NarL family sensor kinase
MHQQQKETYIIILIIATGLFFVLVLFLHLVYKQYQKNRELFIEKLNAEYLGRGEERRRISKDLHDEFGALLSTTKMYLSTLNKDNLDTNTLKKTINSVSEGLNTLHKITNDLYPSALNKNNLNNAIKDMIHEYCSHADIKTTTNIDNVEIDELIDQKSKAQIYWILKEIVINTIKHSKSKTLDMQFSKIENIFIIKTKDEGVGILNNLVSNKGNGITNITNRVEILRGSIEMLNHINKGLEYLIKIPIVYGKEN